MTDLQVRKAWLIGMAALFALAYTQSPYVWSNQNQYYLHGAALAGYGDLRNDWLSNTIDPTPVFSWLVALAYRTTGSSLLAVVYFVLLMAYFIAIDRILTACFGADRPGRWLVLAILLLIHSAAARVISVMLVGNDYPWYLQAGVASQYLLGPGLQPSAFGVLLMIGLANFAEGRSVIAAIWTALSAVVAPTYLPTAGFLVAGYVADLSFRRNHRAALWTSAMAAIVVTPIIIYIASRFLPDADAAWAQPRQRMVDVRLPHHCRVDLWFDGIALVQALIMVLGWWLLRDRPLFRPLGLLLVVSIFLTVIQAANRSYALALMFPWRPSVLLMPIAVAVILQRVMAAYCAIKSPRVELLSVTAIASIAGLAGLWIWWSPMGYYVNHEEDGVIDFVARHHQSGDLYLVPTRIPQLIAGPRGSVSLTFAPPVVTSQSIPPDFQRFRLTTGAAVYVDFKCIPYADREFVDWYFRMTRCGEWYSHEDWSANLQLLQREGVTHIITSTAGAVQGGRFKLLFADDHYRLYRLCTPEP